MGEQKSIAAAELAAMQRLQEASVLLIQEDDAEALYEKILDAAVAVMRSDFASMQMLDPDRGSGGELLLLGFRGFTSEAAKFWRWVRADSATTCGVAFRTGNRAVASDIETCDYMAGTADLDTYRQCGIRSMQTTPLFSRGGKLLGMISTHWREPHQPTDAELRLLDLLARQAADLIERNRSAEALRERNRQLDLLARTSQMLLLGTDQGQPAVRNVFEAVGEALGTEFYFNFLVGDEPQTLHLTHSGGLTQEQRDFFSTIHFGEYLCGTVAQRRERLIVEDLQHSAFPEAAALRAGGVTCYGGFPLIAHGRLIGTIAFATKTRLRFREGEVRMVHTICDQVAAMLDRAALFQKVQKSEHQFRALVDASAQIVWTTDAEGMVVNGGSPSWRAFTGQTSEQERGFGWLDAIPEADREAVAEQWRQAVAGVAPVETEYRLRHVSGEWHWTSVRAVPLIQPDGTVHSWVGMNVDITSRKQADETRELLINELNHRVKNTLATVQAIVQQTLRKASSPEQFVSNFSGRVQALSRVHTLLTKATWQGGDLRELIRDQVVQGPIDENRLTAWGPSVTLEPQMTLHLAMVLHELATNCCKYGALSVNGGWVTVNWTVEREQLRLQWVESGGPLVSAPPARGFGTILIEQSIKAHQGEALMLCEAQGVTWNITLPLPQASAERTTTFPRSTTVQTVAATQTPERKTAARSDLAGKQVLVVEDEPLVALDLVGTLEEAGLKAVGPASTAKAAIRLIETTTLDGALLDANLKGRPVDDIVAALVRKGVPFTFVTGYGQEGLPAAYRSADVVAKPFSREQVLAAAEKLVTRQTGQRDGAIPMRPRKTEKGASVAYISVDVE